jgi:hypothetical protein
MQQRPSFFTFTFTEDFSAAVIGDNGALSQVVPIWIIPIRHLSPAIAHAGFWKAGGSKSSRWSRSCSNFGSSPSNRTAYRSSLDSRLFSYIQANADHHSRIPREQLAEAAAVNRTVREYLAELEKENPVEAPAPQQEQVSTTDPDSTYATKGGPARLGYYNNYLVDNRSCVIVGVQATPARLSQESVAARDMIERYHERVGRLPQSLAADTTYGNGELLQWLDERGIAPYIRVKECPTPTTDLYGIDKFTKLPEENCYVCP